MTVSEDYHDLVEQCRQRCLWFVAPGRIPATRTAQIEILRLIERYGNRVDFERARRLRTWLSQNSNAAFSAP